MNIRILPLPKGGKKGGSILSTIGRYSRPFIKQILRMGLDKLKKKAISRIKQGGENLSKLVTMQQQPQQSAPQRVQPVRKSNGRRTNGHGGQKAVTRR